MQSWKGWLSGILHERFFSHGALEAGLELAEGAHVSVTSLSEKDGGVFIKAMVQGSQRHPYSVYVALPPAKYGGYEVEGICTCPMHHNCKHVVAAIVAAKNRRGSDDPPAALRDAGRPAPPIEIQPTVPESLRGPIGWWLDRLRGVPPAQASRKPASTLESPRRSFLFVVEAVNFMGHHTRVALFRRSFAADGAILKTEPYPLRGGAAKFLADASLSPELADLFRTIFGEYGFVFPINLAGPFAVELLRRILASGRCFHDAAAAAPLHLGPARPARRTWRKLPDASQVPAFEVQPPAAIFLPLPPPWYVDPPSQECGPLQVDGDPAAALAWLTGPPIAPQHLQALGEPLQAVGAPLPAPVTIRNRKSIRPTAILHMERHRLEDPLYGVLPGQMRYEVFHELLLARLSFVYDGQIINAADDRPVLLVETPAGFDQISRQPHVENAFANDLARWHLVKPSTLFPYSLRGNFAGTFTASSDDWKCFMLDAVPRLREAGWSISIDPDFPFRPTPIDDWYASTETSGLDWFSYELGIVVEGQPVNLLPFIPELFRIMREAEGARERFERIDFTLPDGRMVPIPADRLRAIAATLAELFDPDALTDGRLQLSRVRAAELIDLNDNVPWRGPAELKQLAAKLAAFDGIRPVTPPPALHATLRPYQALGLSWLQFLREHGFSGILADDMGLGKTVQALAHVLVEKQEGRAVQPSLIVAPTSLMANWRAEAQRFAPDLRVLVLHGPDRKDHFDRISQSDLVITSYPLLPRDGELLCKQDFHLLILDEAQYIKNPRAKWSETARELRRAAHRLAMTGTPMENHLGELWSILHFLSPGYLGSEKQFRRAYRDPIEKHADAPRRDALARRLRPFILRRRKEDVLKDSAKTEMLRTVELEGPQRDLYESVRLAMQRRVQEEVAKKGMSRSHVVILDALLKLRQIFCCDPRLLKLETARKVAQSAKRELVRDLLPAMIAEGRRILLFSQFTSMLDLLEPDLAHLEIPFVRLDGSTTDRETPVRRFQDRDVPLFLISLKAGGTGLNLTAADTVIHYDPWWNPAVERQATDRAHRIGQLNPVFVYKLITAGTVEEKILELQKRKSQLVADLLSDSPPESLQLSRADLENLFDPLS